MVTDTPLTAARQLSLGISPCPNDTFIFHALLHGLSPSDVHVTRLVMADVEELNGLAAVGGLDVVKLSVAAVVQASRHYRLLSCGGALGRGCGPLLVAGPGLEGLGPEAPVPGDLSRLPVRRLALPGGRTTAALLASLAVVPGERVQMRYDEVMPVVARGEVCAGVVIHEGRFTYRQHGLRLLADFGAWWEGRFGLPLPLGVIGLGRDLTLETARCVSRAIRASLEHAWAAPEDGREFVAAHARELSPEVVAAHIRTFVTPFSLDMGAQGRQAMATLAAEAFRLAGEPMPEDLFWEE